MGEVRNIRVCRRCKKNLGHPVPLDFRGNHVADLMACNECLEKTQSELESVRPVFDAMLACGVDEKLANDTMTFLLDRHFT